MPNAADYRERARLAEGNAERAPNKQLRDQFLELAKAWTRLATMTDPRRIVIPRDDSLAS
jgi:hypothetical protein